MQGHGSDLHHHHSNGSMAHEFVDPVCGMKTEDPGRFMKDEHEGQLYYFCSERCRAKFLEAPGQYVLGSAETPEQTPATAEEGPIYTCPMHPEVRQVGPGSCPICGMALEPVLPGEEEDNGEYLYMRRRFWIGAILTIPLVVIAMRYAFFPQGLLERLAAAKTYGWVELILATPVVLWAGGLFL